MSQRVVSTLLLLALGLLLLSWISSSQALANRLNVTVILSADSAPYTETAQHLIDELERHRGSYRITTVDVESAGHLRLSKPHLVVALGVKAVRAVAAMELAVPAIYALIPKATFEAITQREGKDCHCTAVLLDQSIGRQLDLIRLALPGTKRVGAVLGPTSGLDLKILQAETKKREIQLQVVRIHSEQELIPSLKKVLRESDVLLSLPDPLVFNAQTVQSILLTAYYLHVPVIGFSPAYVKAGALLALHSTPAQLGQQVAKMIKRVARIRPSLPLPQYPETFIVSVNDHVARSLGLQLPGEAQLATQLRGRGVAK